MAPGFETGGAGANFVEYGLGSSFACTCTIPGHDGVEFGSKTTGFTSKKAARNEAAKQAVQFLIAQGLTNPDGTVKKKVTTPGKAVNVAGTKKKVTTPGKVVSVVGNALEVKMDATYAQKVLGMSSPEKSSITFFPLHFWIDCKEDVFQLITDISGSEFELKFKYKSKP